MLTLRGLGGTGFGFLPTRKDWSIGIQHFILFAPVALVCGMLLKFAQPHNGFTVWWKGIALFVATFAGIFGWWRCGRSSSAAACCSRFSRDDSRARWWASSPHRWSSVLSHLTFRQFPNWKFAILATLAGIFYGWAYVRAGSVRASMVTHAIVVATWRTFFA